MSRSDEVVRAWEVYERLRGVIERLAEAYERITGVIERSRRFIEHSRVRIERMNSMYEHLLILLILYNSSNELTVAAVATNIDSNRINSYTDDVENTFTTGWKENGELG